MILGNIHLNNFKGCNDNTKAVGWIIFIVLSKILTARKVIQLINLFGKALSELSVFKVCICHHCLWPFLITDVVCIKYVFSSPEFRERVRSFQENKQFEGSKCSGVAGFMKGP